MKIFIKTALLFSIFLLIPNYSYSSDITGTLTEHEECGEGDPCEETEHHDEECDEDELCDITGTLTSDSPCYLSKIDRRCDVAITVQKQNIDIACIWLTQPRLKLYACAGHDYRTTNWPWTNVNGQTLELRGHSSFPTLDPGWPGNMRTVYDQGIFLDEEIVVAERVDHILPNLISGGICPDDVRFGNCILLTGTNFVGNIQVIVREPGGKVIDVYSGNELDISPDGNTLKFTIIDPRQRLILNSPGGLDFYVRNSAGEDGFVNVVGGGGYIDPPPPILQPLP